MDETPKTGEGPIVLPNGSLVPESACELTFSRAGGPGGQNVNKVDSRVQVRINVTQIPGYPPEAQARLRTLAGKKLKEDGTLLLTCSRHRDQHRNRKECMEKLAELLIRSFQAPRPRIPTRPSRSRKEARLRDKRQASRIKSWRRSTGDD